MSRATKIALMATLLMALSPRLPACFQQDCMQPIPAPPQLQRLPLTAQILAPDELAWGIHWGINDRSSVAGQNEGSTYFRMSLGDSGLETDFGVGAPLVIPYMDIRAQLLGYGWQHGPYLTLEAGGDLMPSRHIGLALGAKFGPISPFVAASVGRSLDKNFIEGDAGLALDLRKQLSLTLGVSRRLNWEAYGDILANTATVALDWHFRVGRHHRLRPPARASDNATGNADGTWPRPMPAPAARLASPGPGGDDPCAFSATIDAFDPSRWEARARCLDALGRPDEARAARAKARALRQEDKDAATGGN